MWRGRAKGSVGVLAAEVLDHEAVPVVGEAGVDALVAHRRRVDLDLAVHLRCPRQILVDLP